MDVQDATGNSDSDSGSDISMESGEEPSSPIGLANPTPAAPSNALTSQAPDAPSKKRKAELQEPSSTSRPSPENSQQKKARVAADGEENENPSSSAARGDRSQLPAEIWHRIFSFTPPRSLGVLLAVNKRFNAYLDPSSSFSCGPLPPTPAGALSTLPPDAIWQASRRFFWPTMPRPILETPELDMWRLACSRVCYFCNKQAPEVEPRGAESWCAGPGPEGVATAWQLRIVTCGPCLIEQTTKVSHIPMSPDCAWKKIQTHANYPPRQQGARPIAIIDLPLSAHAGYPVRASHE